LFSILTELKQINMENNQLALIHKDSFKDLFNLKLVRLQSSINKKDDLAKKLRYSNPRAKFTFN
jgi:hypothetical protein